MAADAGRAPRRGGGALRSPVTWVIVLGIAVAGGAYLLWRRNQAAAAATTSTTTTAAADTAATSGIDPAAAGTLQAEIGDLQSSEAQEAAAGTPAKTGTPAKASPPRTGPDPVTAIMTGNQLTVIWPPVGGASKYQVDVSGKRGSAPVVTQTKAVFSVATVGPSGTVKVRAGNAAGWGPWSASKTFRAPGASRQPAPKAAGSSVRKAA
jgi:hypothetical protein